MDLTPEPTGEERATGSVGHIVALVQDREDGRLVAEAELGEDVDRPRGLPGDAKGRCAVARNVGADELFELALASKDVFSEVDRGEPVDPLVCPAVAGDLVTQLMNPADELGAVEGDVSHDEKRGRDAPLR